MPLLHLPAQLISTTTQMLETSSQEVHTLLPLLAIRSVAGVCECADWDESSAADVGARAGEQ